MRLAAKFGLPVIAFIDTPGAYPGVGAEERGQAWVIAENMYEMSRLPTPIICVVIGEGGSGGALGIGVGDRVAMLQHAYYSVISPEGCAGILWKSHEYAEQAARALRFTSKDLLRVRDHRRGDPRTAGRRPPRPSPDGRPAEVLPGPDAPRTAGQAAGQAAATTATKNFAGWAFFWRSPAGGGKRFRIAFEQAAVFELHGFAAADARFALARRRRLPRRGPRGQAARWPAAARTPVEPDWLLARHDLATSAAKPADGPGPFAAVFRATGNVR